ncbi:hypothetical protein [Streptomyces sp. NPDC055189]
MIAAGVLIVAALVTGVVTSAPATSGTASFSVSAAGATTDGDSGWQRTDS